MYVPPSHANQCHYLEVYYFRVMFACIYIEYILSLMENKRVSLCRDVMAPRECQLHNTNQHPEPRTTDS